MNLKNCTGCGKLYVENPSGLCPECFEKEEKEELIITEYMRKVDKASMKQIHEETGVSERTIMRMMKKGRFVGNFEISYPCELCGAPITEGRLCNDCGMNILSQANKEKAKDEKKEAERQAALKRSGRMYTREKD
ncbi:MAG: flagellar protein [Pelosinus sp.]|nr:flagellar protein [Pelosinus sp.]